MHIVDGFFFYYLKIQLELNKEKKKKTKNVELLYEVFELIDAAFFSNQHCTYETEHGTFCTPCFSILKGRSFGSIRFLDCMRLHVVQHLDWRDSDVKSKFEAAQNMIFKFEFFA